MRTLRLWFGKIGLGPNSWGPFRYLLPYNKLFHQASRYHDVGYSQGGDERQRYNVDEMFFKLMNAVSKNKIQKLFARIYYKAVRHLGFMFFNKKTCND